MSAVDILRDLFVPQSCNLCDHLGVNCIQKSRLGFGNNHIHIDGVVAFRTEEPISGCPAVTGQNTNEEVVENLRKQNEKAKNRTSIRVFKITNY